MVNFLRFFILWCVLGPSCLYESKEVVPLSPFGVCVGVLVFVGVMLVVSFRTSFIARTERSVLVLMGVCSVVYLSTQFLHVL
jgi:hypothetical protein